MEPQGDPRPELVSIDVDQAMSHVDGDRGLLRELIESFSTGAPLMLAAMRDAVSARDTERLAKTTHELQGSLGLFGAIHATEAARRVQEACKAGEHDEALRLAAALQDEMETVLEALARFAGELAA